MAFGGSWSWQVAGRLIAGTGGVLLNVQMTKMVADWFAGKEIATAMAIFVNSWPAGVALSLLTLPVDRHRLWRQRGPSLRRRADGGRDRADLRLSAAAECGRGRDILRAARFQDADGSDGRRH